MPSQVSLSKLQFTKEGWDQALKALEDGIEKWDYDSGWVATPADKVINHQLKTLPTLVNSMASDSANGDNFVPTTFQDCNRTTVTIHTNKPYCRVVISR